MKTRRMAGAGLFVTLALTLAGCSSHRAASPATSSTSVSTSTDTTQVPVVSTATTTTSTSTSSTTTRAPASALCRAASLSVARGTSSGAAGTIALGFVVSNIGTAKCVISGYPTITLVPASGTVRPVITHVGAAGVVEIVGKGSAGFVVEYGDEPVDGQATCPTMTAVDVVLPYPGSVPVAVPAGFSPCGAPDVRLSAVLSSSQYERLVG